MDQPDDDDDAVEDVVGVPDVAEQAEGQQHEAHLQDEHAGENDVADLQHVGQLLGLERERGGGSGGGVKSNTEGKSVKRQADLRSRKATLSSFHFTFSASRSSNTMLHVNGFQTQAASLRSAAFEVRIGRTDTSAQGAVPNSPQVEGPSKCVLQMRTTF